MAVDYHEYLASRDWALKREAVKERAGNICERCFLNSIKNVHHLSYANVGDEPLEDLQGLCRPCHEYLSAKRDDDPLNGLPQPTRSINFQDGKFTEGELIKCFVCGFNCVRVTGPEYKEGQDNYQAWAGRGDCLDVAFRCENGHRFILRFGVHKGETFSSWFRLNEAGEVCA